MMFIETARNVTCAEVRKKAIRAAHGSNSSSRGNVLGTQSILDSRNVASQWAEAKENSRHRYAAGRVRLSSKRWC